MALSVLTAERNTLITAYGALFNSGTIEVYSGAVPADVNASLGAAVLLGTLSFSASAFGAASAGTITAAAITQDSAADASGTASFCRARKTGAGTYIEQGTAGVGSGDYQFNTTTIVAGGPISCTAMTRTWGA